MISKLWALWSGRKLRLGGQYLFTTLALLTVSAQANIDVEKDLVAPLNNVDVDFSKHEQIDFAVVKRPQVATDTHTDFELSFENNKMAFRMVYDDEAAKHPEKMIRDMALFDFWRTQSSSTLRGLTVNPSGLLNTDSTTIYNVSEVLADMKSGSAPARARWVRWQVDALKSAAVSDDFEKQFPGARAYLETQRLLAQKELDSLPRKCTTSDALNVDLDQLSQRVLKNDRAGVADMVRKALPWQDMEPTEAGAWRVWLPKASSNPTRVHVSNSHAPLSGKNISSSPASQDHVRSKSCLPLKVCSDLARSRP